MKNLSYLDYWATCLQDLKNIENLLDIFSDKQDKDAATGYIERVKNIAQQTLKGINTQTNSAVNNKVQIEKIMKEMSTDNTYSQHSYGPQHHQEFYPHQDGLAGIICATHYLLHLERFKLIDMSKALQNATEVKTGYEEIDMELSRKEICFSDENFKIITGISLKSKDWVEQVKDKLIDGIPTHKAKAAEELRAAISEKIVNMENLETLPTEFIDYLGKAGLLNNDQLLAEVFIRQSKIIDPKLCFNLLGKETALEVLKKDQNLFQHFPQRLREDVDCLEIIVTSLDQNQDIIIKNVSLNTLFKLMQKLNKDETPPYANKFRIILSHFFNDDTTAELPSQDDFAKKSFETWSKPEGVERTKALKNLLPSERPTIIFHLLKHKLISFSELMPLYNQESESGEKYLVDNTVDDLIQKLYPLDPQILFDAAIPFKQNVKKFMENPSIRINDKLNVNQRHSLINLVHPPQYDIRGIINNGFQSTVNHVGNNWMGLPLLFKQNSNSFFTKQGSPLPLSLEPTDAQTYLDFENIELSQLNIRCKADLNVIKTAFNKKASSLFDADPEALRQGLLNGVFTESAIAKACESKVNQKTVLQDLEDKLANNQAVLQQTKDKFQAELNEANDQLKETNDRLKQQILMSNQLRDSVENLQNEIKKLAANNAQHSIPSSDDDLNLPIYQISAKNRASLVKNDTFKFEHRYKHDRQNHSILVTWEHNADNGIETLTGDKLKRRCLNDLAAHMISFESVDKLDQFFENVKQGKAEQQYQHRFDVLQKYQGYASRFFALKIGSMKTFEHNYKEIRGIIEKTKANEPSGANAQSVVTRA